jgi:hypothetical protein
MGGMLLARVGCVACDAAIDANTQERANRRWNARQSAPPQTTAPQGEMPPLDNPLLQELFSSTICGAMAFGEQNTNKPPEGHWLTQFWNYGRMGQTVPAVTPLGTRHELTGQEAYAEWERLHGKEFREALKECNAQEQGARHEAASPVSTATNSDRGGITVDVFEDLLLEYRSVMDADEEAECREGLVAVYRATRNQIPRPAASCETPSRFHLAASPVSTGADAKDAECDDYPIVRVTVRENAVVEWHWYTPTLPDGEFDLCLDPAMGVGRDTRDAARYRYLRSRDLDAIHTGGVFIGETPQNYVINGEHADAAIDAAMSDEAGKV